MNKTFLRFVVFFSGFCLMLVQLVSGRALAPYVGTSIYTWTNIIATTLFAIVIGYYLGGLLADKKSGRFTLGATLAAGGAAAVLSTYLLIMSDQFFGMANLHIATRSLFYAFGAFFPVALLLAAVMPQAVKLELVDLAHTGRTVGSLSFWNSLGSIAGTAVGGFVLIQAVGTKHALFLIAVSLMLLGIIVAKSTKLWKSPLGFLAGLVLIGDLFLPSGCVKETNYYCIRILKDSTTVPGETRLILRLDHLVHSYVLPDDPGNLGYGYEQVYARLLVMKHTSGDTFKTFFIGGGGYVLPRYLEAYYPNAAVRVAEVDPGVTKINYEKLGLNPETKIQSVNLDARQDLEKGGGPYDLVFGDAFNDFSVPFHLTTVEFHQLLKSRMSEKGVYALNIIDDRRYGAFLASMVRTLRTVWKNVYIAPQAEQLEDGRNTIVLIATDEPLDQEAWNKAIPFSHGKKTLTLDSGSDMTSVILSPEKVDAFLAEHAEPALTDAFVPVERYLAPVFRDAY